MLACSLARATTAIRGAGFGPGLMVWSSAHRDSLHTKIPTGAAGSGQFLACVALPHGHSTRDEMNNANKLESPYILCHARQTVGIRMALLTAERLFWHCGAHIAEPQNGPMGPIPPIPYNQCLPFSGTCQWHVARGGWVALGTQQKDVCGASSSASPQQRGQGGAWPKGVRERAPRRRPCPRPVGRP